MSPLPPDPKDAIGEARRARLASGHHEAVARELMAEDKAALAGWVFEQIWDFDAAARAFLEAEAPLDALRCALEERAPPLLEEVLERLETRAIPDELKAGARLLEKRRQHHASARLLAHAKADPSATAGALLRAGERLAAARALAAGGDARAALEALGALDDRAHRAGSANAAEHAFAAQQCWNLGDAEGAARNAQAARRLGHDDQDIKTLLARALGSLGHDLAAQIVIGIDGFASLGATAGARGRYQVTGVLPAPFAGAAYVGLDRVTLQEVEVHLLLAEYAEHEQPGPVAREAITTFLQAAMAAARLKHPAIRDILRIQPEMGLLVMPRAEGPGLRALIRPPGMGNVPARARSMIAFLLEGLAVAHAQGMVHGALFPAQIVSDNLGRPLLGPFGTHHLAGIEATRTGGLEEMLVMTAPELSHTPGPTRATDIYTAGILLGSLLTGSLYTDELRRDAASLPESERAIVEAMTDDDPAQRPSARDLLQRLRIPVADLSRLSGRPSAADSSSGPVRRPKLAKAVPVTAAPAWNEAMLAALCEARAPWLQPILDRDDRTLYLAPWPADCRKLGDNQSWRPLLSPDALASLAPLTDASPDLRAHIEARLDASCLVATPAGEWMLALDQLLLR